MRVLCFNEPLRPEHIKNRLLGHWGSDPGFLDVVTNRSPDVVRIYLPPDANCLLSVTDHCLRSTLAIFGIAMSPVPAAFVGGTLVASAAFGFVLDFAKSVFTRLVKR